MMFSLLWCVAMRVERDGVKIFRIRILWLALADFTYQGLRGRFNDSRPPDFPRFSSLESFISHGASQDLPRAPQTQYK